MGIEKEVFKKGVEKEELRKGETKKLRQFMVTDKHGDPHFGETQDEAVKEALQANEGYKN